MTASGARRSSLHRFEQASGFGQPEEFLEKLALRMGLLILVDAGVQHASECTSTKKSCMQGEHPKASAAVSKAVGCPRQTLAHGLGVCLVARKMLRRSITDSQTATGQTARKAHKYLQRTKPPTGNWRERQVLQESGNADLELCNHDANSFFVRSGFRCGQRVAENASRWNCPQYKYMYAVSQNPMLRHTLPSAQRAICCLCQWPLGKALHKAKNLRSEGWQSCFGNPSMSCTQALNVNDGSMGSQETLVQT